MKSNKEILTQKKYKHFDVTRPPSTELLNALSNETFIKQHSFWPFLHFQLKTTKYYDKVKTPKSRELYYSSHLDSYIYQYYNHKLSSFYESYLIEKNLTNYPIAYRSLEKSNIHFAAESFEFISKNPNSLVLCFDIEKFFDRLDHSILKENLLKIQNLSKLPEAFYKVFKSLTNFSWVERNEALKILNLKQNDILNINRLCSAKDFRNKIRKNNLIHQNHEKYGIPQGSALSALFSNIYMIEFDLQLSKFAKKENGFYKRYSDDIILIIPCPSYAKEYYNEFVKNLINSIKLNISEKKTEIVKLNGGIPIDGKQIQYLGFIYMDGEIRIRPKTVTSYYKKVYKRIEIIKKVQKIKQNDKIFLKRFYENYTHLGKDNFISYVKRAKKIFKNESLEKDTKHHWNKIYKKFNP
ncbi:reverse transcriptase domain-containing protein [Leptospira sp. 96542]|nr:reverse transcriptase domain-containing protein [Leptospira sp. 96542]